MQTCTVTSVVIFLINLSCTVLFKAKWGSENDINSIYQGDCSQTEKISTGLHVVINLLSTLLLGASNLCMQLLAAPTRSEIDKAHEKFVWLDTGVPSIRNLRCIGRERLVSSMCYPRHTLHSPSLSVSATRILGSPKHTNLIEGERRYNPAVFPTLASNSHNWVVVTPNYLTGAPWDLSATNTSLKARAGEEVLGLVSDSGLPVMQPLAASIDQAPWPASGSIVQMQTAVHNGAGFTILSPLNYLEQYSTPFEDRSDVILVALNNQDIQNANNSVLACGTQGAVDRGVHKGSHTGEWMCRQSNTFSCKRLAAHGYDEDLKISAIAHWNVVGYEKDYCMASYRPTGNRCGVVYSYRIMIGK